MYIKDSVFVKGTLVEMIELVIDSPAIGHPYKMTMVKLKSCENF